MKQARETGRSRKALGAPEIEGPSLPADRAFVVQFRTGADGGRPIAAGRVEHLASGRGRHFASWDELRTFVERTLRAVSGTQTSTADARGAGKGKGVACATSRRPSPAHGGPTMRPLARTIVTALLGVFCLGLLPCSSAAARTERDRAGLGPQAPSPGDTQNPCQPSTGDPDFSNVSDILCGRRYLLRIDDVVVVSVNQGMATTVIAPTSNSHMSTTVFEGAFAVSNPNPAFSSPASQGEDVAPLALGRMVNLPRDVLVSLLLGTDAQWHLFVRDVQTNTGVAVVVPTGIPPASQGRSEQAVVLADFDGDGYVEALIAYLGQDAQGQLEGGMRIVKPVDVNDLSQGVTFGPEVLSTNLGLPFSTLKTGDVNGDGLSEILSFNGTTLSVSTVVTQCLQRAGH